MEHERQAEAPWRCRASLPELGSPGRPVRHSHGAGQRLTQELILLVLVMRRTTGAVCGYVSGSCSVSRESSPDSSRMEGAVTRLRPGGERAPVTIRFRCNGGRESVVIGHGHDGAGGSLGSSLSWDREACRARGWWKTPPRTVISGSSPPCKRRLAHFENSNS